jgi:alpha-N-acetylglucosaminidase
MYVMRAGLSRQLNRYNGFMATNRLRTLFATVLVFFGPFLLPAQNNRNQETMEMRQLLMRLLPEHAGDFVIEKMNSSGIHDVFELESRGRKIVLRGNSNNAMAVALNHYLKYYCKVAVSWYAHDPVRMPETLPAVPGKIRMEAIYRNRFFLNYCTFGYTMPWWKWKDWERLIDWMALNGINMPLAITGEEGIWYKVWRKLGLTDRQIRAYFAGPAYLPWHRMSNLDRWGGPLSLSYIEQQLSLQKKILQRERSLGMTPVLPAFAGHVPEALRDRFPKAKISRLSEWGGFADRYRSFFLDPSDPLFTKIQHAFIHEQTKEFGTGHIYGADPFNEVRPPQWDTAYLAGVARTIYASLHDLDRDATWLMMTWIFYFERDNWTNERVKAFLKAVPQDKIMLLDYYCEHKEVWKMTDSYFGQPFLWCYLGNFGGNTMLAGNLADVSKRMENAFDHAGDHLSGIGSTLEGFDVNPIMYDYLFERSWTGNHTQDITQWVQQYADRRCGYADTHCRKAWEILFEKIYQQPATLGQATLTNARPCLTGSGNWTTNPQIAYDNRDLLDAWELLLKASDRTSPSYQFDVANTGRQVLGNYFLLQRDRFTAYYKERNIPGMKQTAARMMALMDDLDSLLGTQSCFLLGKWLNDARSMGSSIEEKNKLEQNARMLITTWGGKAQSLNDYGNRAWAGLMKDYYKERWKLFLDDVIEASETDRPFDEKAFYEKVTAFEWDWTRQHKSYTGQPAGNAAAVSDHLLKKYEYGIRSGR